MKQKTIEKKLIEFETTNEKLIKLLSDKIARDLICLIQENPKSVVEMAQQGNFSTNSAYLRVRELDEMNLLKVTGEINSSGRRRFFYQSKIKSYILRFENGKTTLKIFLNENN